MFKWDNKYSVGVVSIDTQHQSLFAVGRELRDAMEAGKAKTAVGRILDRLANYTSMHFAHEERLMQLHGYPGLAAHKAEHDALRRQVEEYRAAFRSGNTMINLQLLLFLKQWLLTHIGGSDMNFAPYVRAQARNPEIEDVAVATDTSH
jgi:hemerythrin